MPSCRLRKKKGVVIGTEEIQANKENFVVVGKFLTEKNINFNAMQNVLASLWRPKEGMEIHDIEGNRFSFVFYHVMDLQKMVEGGPWSFEQNMLVYNTIAGMTDPHTVPLEEVEIWVQLYDIPTGFLSEKILQSVGNYIGKFVKSDPSNLDGRWKAYVHVKMNVMKPIKRRIKLKREGGEWSWVTFKYEHLSTFCFVCGMLGIQRENVVLFMPTQIRKLTRRMECGFEHQIGTLNRIRELGGYEILVVKVVGRNQGARRVHRGGGNQETRRLLRRDFRKLMGECTRYTEIMG